MLLLFASSFLPLQSASRKMLAREKKVFSIHIERQQQQQQKSFKLNFFTRTHTHTFIRI
jgi:hypothetical protein